MHFVYANKSNNLYRKVISSNLHQQYVFVVVVVLYILLSTPASVSYTSLELLAYQANTYTQTSHNIIKKRKIFGPYAKDGL